MSFFLLPSCRVPFYEEFLKIVDPSIFTQVLAKELCSFLRMTVGDLAAFLTSPCLVLIFSFEGQPVLVKVFHFLMIDPTVLNEIFKLSSIFITISCLVHFNNLVPHISRMLFRPNFFQLFFNNDNVCSNKLLISRKNSYFSTHLIMFNNGQITVILCLL